MGWERELTVYTFWFWNHENEKCYFLKQVFLNNRSDFGPAVLLIWAAGLGRGFLWSEMLHILWISSLCRLFIVPFIGGWDLDELRLLEKVWGVWSLLQRCQALFLGVYAMRTLPWCDSVGSSPKVKDYSEERLFWSTLANCSFIGRKKWQNVFPDYF